MEENFKGGFEELVAWKESRKFRLMCVELIKQFSSEEKYRLTDQLTRCSRGIETQLQKAMDVSIIKRIFNIVARDAAH